MIAPFREYLSPAAKDPAEGARDASQATPTIDAHETSHLGPAGDPAEGIRPKPS